LKNSENAQPMLDYIPIDQKVEFGPGENMKIIKVELIDNHPEENDEVASGVHYAINSGSGLDDS
jgi:hypothetical protein